MKKLKKIIVILVVLVGLLFVIGLFLPRVISLARTVSLDKQYILIAYDYVNDLHKWDAWSPWHKIDPSTKWEYSSDSAVGQGAWYIWEGGDKVGSGKLTITKSEFPLSIDTHMDFGEMGQADAQFLFDTTVTPSTITWNFSTDMGFNPFGRYFAFMISKHLGPQYEEGLEGLKSVSMQ